MTIRSIRNVAVNFACAFALLYLLHLGTSQGLPQFHQALSDVRTQTKATPQFQIQYPSRR